MSNIPTEANMPKTDHPNRIFLVEEKGGKTWLTIFFPEGCEELACIHQSDEYDYTVPDLDVCIDVKSLFTAVRLLGENPDTLHSEGYEGKMRYARLIVTPFPFGSPTYFLEFFNDWTDTLYELDLSAQMYEFFGSETPLDRLNAVLCETGKS